MNQKQFVFERKYAKKLAELQPNANNQKIWGNKRQKF